MEEVPFFLAVFVDEICSQSLTNQLPRSWLDRFQLSGQPDAKGHSEVIWRSHGEFDQLPSAVDLAKSLARVKYALAKCRPGPFLDVLQD